MDSWPGTLPLLKTLRGYSETPPDTILRTEMDAGVDKIRSQTSTGARPIKGSMRLTTAQIAYLDTFYWTTLGRGALSFTASHPRTDATETFRFTKPPNYDHRSGDFYLVPIELEII